MFKKNDKVKTGYGIGIVIDMRILQYCDIDYYSYYIKYPDGECLWAFEDSLEMVVENE